MSNKSSEAAAVSNMKNLKGEELSSMLSSLSPDARAEMLKLRFATTIAKANPNMKLIDHTEQQQQKKKKKKINKRKLRESPPPPHIQRLHQTTNGALADHKKRIISAVDEEQEEEDQLPRSPPSSSSSLRKCKTLLPQEDEDQEVNEEEILRKEKIASERKAFRLKLLELERTTEVVDNFKVMRDFERLVSGGDNSVQSDSDFDRSGKPPRPPKPDI